MPKTTNVGYRNKNNQVVIRNTGKLGNDHNQKIYELQCQNEQPGASGICGNLYGANGSDIWQRKCPRCQGGAKGLGY